MRDVNMDKESKDKILFVCEIAKNNLKTILKNVQTVNQIIEDIKKELEGVK